MAAMPATMTFPAQAQTTNICDATRQVRDEILRVTPAEDACDSVFESGMGNINLALFR